MEGKEKVDAELTEGEIVPDAQGKHPEVVPWDKYVGIKESLGKKLDIAKGQVKSLEEQLKSAPKVEEFNRIQRELESARTQLSSLSGELTKAKEATVSELRVSLKAKGVSEERLSKMAETEMRAVLEVLGSTKPLPDLGGIGGGSGELQGSPKELAVRAYEMPRKQK